MTAKKRYDVGMIRDFLAHLFVELRISLELPESAEPIQTGKINAELMDQLTRFAEKYDAALLPMYEVSSDGLGKEEFNEAKKRMNQKLVNRRKQQMEHLRALQDLFDEALACASRVASEGLPSKSVSATDLLD